MKQASVYMSCKEIYKLAKTLLRKKIARRKRAGWWSLEPMGGDSPLDLLGVIEEKTPAQAKKEIVKDLKRDDIAYVYSALGVWNFVMLSNYDKYKKAFRSILPLVKNSAKRMLNKIEAEEEKEEYGEPYDWEVVEWAGRATKQYLKGYSQGKIFSNVGYSGDFTPKVPLTKRKPSSPKKPSSRTSVDPIKLKRLRANRTIRPTEKDIMRIDVILAKSDPVREAKIQSKKIKSSKKALARAKSALVGRGRGRISRERLEVAQVFLNQAVALGASI